MQRFFNFSFYFLWWWECGKTEVLWIFWKSNFIFWWKSHFDSFFKFWSNTGKGMIFKQPYFGMWLHKKCFLFVFLILSNLNRFQTLKFPTFPPIHKNFQKIPLGFFFKKPINLNLPKHINNAAFFNISRYNVCSKALNICMLEIRNIPLKTCQKRMENILLEYFFKIKNCFLKLRGIFCINIVSEGF